MRQWPTWSNPVPFSLIQCTCAVPLFLGCCVICHMVQIAQCGKVLWLPLRSYRQYNRLSQFRFDSFKVWHLDIMSKHNTNYCSEGISGHFACGPFALGGYQVMPIHYQTKFTKQLPVTYHQIGVHLRVWSIDWGVKGLLGDIRLLWIIPAMSVKEWLVHRWFQCTRETMRWPVRTT